MSENTSKIKKQQNSPAHGPMGGRGGPMGQMIAIKKAKDFKGTTKKLLKYISHHLFWVIIVILFAMISTVFTIVGPKVLGQATTKLYDGIMSQISGGTGGIDFAYIGNIILILAALYIISTLFSIIQGYIMSRISMKVTYNLRRDILEKIYRLPLRYFDQTTHGEVISYISNDVDTISQSLNQSMTQLITSITMIIGILVMMLSISWQMSLVALLIVPISMLIITQIIKRSQKHFKGQQKYLGNLNGHIEEMYGGHTVMKAFNGEQDSLKTFDKYNEKLYTSAWKSQFLSGLMMPVTLFVGNLGYVGICILGGYLVANGKITIGDIQAFVQYVRQFTQPITQVSNISNVLQQTIAAAERIFEFLEQPEEIKDVLAPVSTKDIQGNIEFKNVKFGYSPDKIIINDFNAKVKKGQKIAIVGPTGAGKTTIVKLLMRFYDINDGKILIDDVNINAFTRHDLRSMFGMVLQDTWLYNASINDNIKYGSFGKTDKEIKDAAKAAQVDHFVRALPNGYDMILNEEASNISQGQKQLLTIARVILADPKILILDEATSSVDTRTEILIQKAMDNLMQNRTSFVIAHRLSTIKNADLILVMKEGDIVEQGTHEELLQKGNFYANLYNSQFESEGIK